MLDVADGAWGPMGSVSIPLPYLLQQQLLYPLLKSFYPVIKQQNIRSTIDSVLELCFYFVFQKYQYIQQLIWGGEDAIKFPFSSDADVVFKITSRDMH